MVPDPVRLAKWNEWLEQIQSELVNLLASRKIYKGYGDIVKPNESVRKSGAAFHNWVTDNYVTFVAMAIRRQLDTSSDSISLARLITDIKDNPEHLTRTAHVAFYANMPFGVGDSQGNSTFTKYAGSGEFIDTAIPQADLVDLQAASQAVGRLASRKIAHKSTRTVPSMTFDDVDECIEAIKVIAQKYILLLQAAHNVLEPIIDDWQEAFTETWIVKSSS